MPRRLPPSSLAGRWGTCTLLPSIVELHHCWLRESEVDIEATDENLVLLVHVSSECLLHSQHRKLLSCCLGFSFCQL